MTETLRAGRQANYNSQHAQFGPARGVEKEGLVPRILSVGSEAFLLLNLTVRKKVCEAQRGLDFLMAARK